MDNIQKFLRKLSPKQQNILYEILSDIISDDIDKYDVKKLTNETDMYRVRVGQIRILFRKTLQWNILVNVDFRGSVYKK